MPAMCTSGKLSVDDKFAPPEHKRSTGCAANKRLDIVAHKTNIKRQCQACGNDGHFASNCPDPSTQFRWEEHVQKAIHVGLIIKH